MWWQRTLPRITIKGLYLDKLQIHRQSTNSDSIYYLPFPAHRRWAHVEGNRVTVCGQDATVVELFAGGILRAVGRRDADIEVGGEKMGRCLLAAVESGESNGLDRMITLRFRRLSEAWV